MRGTAARSARSSSIDGLIAGLDVDADTAATLRAAALFRGERCRVQRAAIDHLAQALPLAQLHVPFVAGRIDGAALARLAVDVTGDVGISGTAAPAVVTSRRVRRRRRCKSVIDAVSVVVCCGSGGVGKTTVAAALGVEAARRGRRVVVLTIDPAKRLADALGVDALGPEPSRVDLDGVTAKSTASCGR